MDETSTDLSPVALVSAFLDTMTWTRTFTDVHPLKLLQWFIGFCFIYLIMLINLVLTIHLTWYMFFCKANVLKCGFLFSFLCTFTLIRRAHSFAWLISDGTSPWVMPCLLHALMFHTSPLVCSYSKRIKEERLQVTSGPSLCLPDLLKISWLVPTMEVLKLANPLQFTVWCAFHEAAVATK